MSCSSITGPEGGAVRPYSQVTAVPHVHCRCWNEEQPKSTEHCIIADFNCYHLCDQFFHVMPVFNMNIMNMSVDFPLLGGQGRTSSLRGDSVRLDSCITKNLLRFINEARGVVFTVLQELSQLKAEQAELLHWPIGLFECHSTEYLKTCCWYTVCCVTALVIPWPSLWHHYEVKVSH